MYVKSQRVTSAINSSSLIPLRIVCFPMKNTATAMIKAMMVMPTSQKSHCPVVRGGCWTECGAQCDTCCRYLHCPVVGDGCWAEFVQGAVKMTTIPTPLATMPTMEHNVKTQSGARRTRAKTSRNLRRIAITSIKRKIIDMLQKMVAAASNMSDMMLETSFVGMTEGARINMKAARSAASAL